MNNIGKLEDFIEKEINLKDFTFNRVSVDGYFLRDGSTWRMERDENQYINRKAC